MIIYFLVARDPNCEHRHSNCLHEWPRYSADHKHYLELNIKHLDDYSAHSARGRGHREEACAFWATHIPKLLETSGTIHVTVHLSCLAQCLQNINRTIFVLRISSFFCRGAIRPSKSAPRKRITTRQYRSSHLQRHLLSCRVISRCKDIRTAPLLPLTPAGRPPPWRRPQLVTPAHIMLQLHPGH